MQVLSTEVQNKVVEAFEVFDHENSKTVDVREVGTIIRSLGHCPSESQLQETISEMEDAEQMGTQSLHTAQNPEDMPQATFISTGSCR